MWAATQNNLNQYWKPPPPPPPAGLDPAFLLSPIDVQKDIAGGVDPLCWDECNGRTQGRSYDLPGQTPIYPGKSFITGSTFSVEGGVNTSAPLVCSEGAWSACGHWGIAFNDIINLYMTASGGTGSDYRCAFYQIGVVDNFSNEYYQIASYSGIYDEVNNIKGPASAFKNQNFEFDLRTVSGNFGPIDESPCGGYVVVFLRAPLNNSIDVEINTQSPGPYPIPDFC